MVSRLIPAANCRLCPRLAAFRQKNTTANPDWHNAPVPSFGDDDAKILIVGLAPGLKGANRTGRPFTGDYAGDLLYPTLLKFGLAEGTYDERADDGLALIGCRITNAVRCVPPQNKPTGPEVKTCRDFLSKEINGLKSLRIILSLGVVAHNAVMAVFGEKLSARKFKHASVHNLPNGMTVVDSYHCSRYNTNTGRLTPAMFHQVFKKIKALG
ncbi:MAG: uracil-DNA glycosylase [Rhodospirillaceae bacterium]|jgi:uracil-DNA glycosylase family 4